MHPVGLVAACTRSGNVRFRVTEGDDRVGHNGLRQSEELFLCFYPIHLRPGAQPDCTKPQFLRRKADILGGNKIVLVGSVIQEQITKGRNQPFAAALSAVLMVLTSVMIRLYRKITGTSQLEGML